MPPAGAPDAVRAFVALELPAETQARLASLQAELRPGLPSVRFTASENLHLTLRFLGDSRPTALAQVRAALEDAARVCPPLAARLRGLGLFPERGAPRVLWLGMELPAAGGELQQACEQAARRAGFAPEQRPFVAHLTLGRWRDSAPRPVLPECELGTLTLAHLALIRSELHPQGPRYSTLARFTLGA